MRDEWARRSLRACGLALASAAACLDPNADFDGPVSTTGAAETSSAETASAGSSSGAETSGAETSAVCEGDGFDNEVDEAPVQIGSYTAVLETPQTRDRFNFYADADAPNELHITADVDVRVCAFLECTDSVEPSVPTCIAPATSGASEQGQSGCCGKPGMGLQYACDVDLGAKFHIVIDEAPADCTHYGFDVAYEPP